MPPAFIAATAFIGAELGSAYLIIYAVEIGTALFYASTIAYSAYSARKARAAAKKAGQANIQDRLVMLSTTDGPRSRLYGRVRNVEGILFKATRGKKSEIYTLVIGLAGHEVDAIETIYFDDKPVTLDSDGYVLTKPYGKEVTRTVQQVIGLGPGSYTLTSSAVAGSIKVHEITAGGIPLVSDPISVTGTSVTVGLSSNASRKLIYETRATESKARIRMFRGAPGQDLSTILQPLFPSLITSADKFAGVACLIADLEYDTDAWSTGVPTISALMRGAKVLDPRTGTTVWSENPALIALDWAKYAYGGAIPDASIDVESFKAAANACDVMTTFPGVAGARPLYVAGTVARTDQSPDEVLGEMVEAMAGRWGWASGQLRVRAGAYRAPVASITEDWLSGVDEINIVPEPPADEAVNVLRPTIADAANGYIATPTLPVSADAYITLDGRELPQDVTYAAITDGVRTTHVAGVQLREARSGLTVSLPCNLRAFALQLFDVVTVTLSRYGWTNKLFEVIDWRFSLQGGIVLSLRETTASIFDPAGTFDLVDATPNTALPEVTSVDKLGALTVTSGTAALTDGSIITRTRVQWPTITDQAVLVSGQVEVQYTLASDSIPAGAWSSVIEQGGATETVIVGLRGQAVYLFRARLINSLGVRSDWSPVNTHTVAAPPDAGVKLLTLSASSLFFRIGAGGANQPSSITITAKLTSALVGTPSFAVVSGTATLAGSGNTRTLAFADMGSDVVTITASLTDAGTVYSDTLTLIKLRDGQPGPAGTAGATGPRGNVDVSVSVTGTSWSDSAANNALTTAGYGSPVLFDRVTQYNVAADFVQTRYWTGTAWIPFTTLINGNQIVDGSVLARALSVENLAAISAVLGEVDVGVLNSLVELRGVIGTFSGRFTAQAVNAVDTINVKGEALIAPRGAAASSAFTLTSGAGDATVLTAPAIDIPPIDVSPAPTVIVSWGAVLESTTGTNFGVVVRIKRNGTPVYETPSFGAASDKDISGVFIDASAVPGPNVYTMSVQGQGMTLRQRYVVAVGNKR